MKAIKIILAILLVVSLLTAAAEEGIIATVNGEELSSAALKELEEQYLDMYSQSGYDTSDESVQNRVSDIAMTYLIEDMLIEQDMRDLGFFDFDDESLTEEQRQQQAAQRYRDYLLAEEEPGAEQLLKSYEERVEQSKSLYENDIPAYETALYYNQPVWYAPDGYRSVLQILLASDSEELEDEVLKSSADTLAEITSRLNNGEKFQDLIAQYGEDANFDDPAFFDSGYQVHKDSILWEEAFIDAAFSMDKPGDVSEPFTSPNGVHILYYLGDVSGGAVEYTTAVEEALRELLLEEKFNEKLEQRVDELAEAADVQIME